MFGTTWFEPVAGMAIGVACFAFIVSLAEGSNPPVLDVIKARYQRPATLPTPRDNPLTPDVVSLGRKLFAEKKLSADDGVACATCHDPNLAFTDGVSQGQGIAKEPLKRHTPALWNLAWAKALFWDGRATSLEDQARGPIEHPKEMGQPLSVGVDRLKGDTDYQPAFARAFPMAPQVSEENVIKALAAYERTLVSPSTRFDAWVAGDQVALSESEIAGFVLFNGKAGCSSCHSGWNFTDHAFHDIGLPGDDLGRGPIIGLPGLNRAFKTPSLRELTWTAPYMHDGSLATIDDVVRFYETGGVDRPTRSQELPKALPLTDRERDDLVAFLETLSSARPPRPMPIEGLPVAGSETAVKAISASLVSQKDKAFKPAAVAVDAGKSLRVFNDDVRPHNVRIFDPRFSFNSGLQEPGDTATITLPSTGIYEAFCGIHPSMRLRIEVR